MLLLLLPLLLLLRMVKSGAPGDLWGEKSAAGTDVKAKDDDADG
jgi:hypothetical protein